MNFTKLCAFILILAAAGCGSETKTTTKSRSHTREKKVLSADSIKAKYGEGLYAQINITEGDVLVRLEMEKAPLTVANFVALAEGSMPNDARPAGEPYYDGLNFHRVINLANGDSYNFMIQGGDPDGNGQGGPGYQFRNEIHPLLKHSGPGILAMANSGPNTNGSQFYITNDAQPSLDGSYNVFGKVVEGQSRVDQTLKGDKLFYVAIIRVGEMAKNFDAVETFNSLK
ncbi:MAG: peptidylprolyl isomerase [Bacteroidetes bacterium]|jgi:peptidyl-prolyl cis-trans isomerase A (cyclophilin A)|nr:peptidylprolyl isomerase [Bacteroidota bacterium]